jgi:hypothetical protein
MTTYAISDVDATKELAGAARGFFTASYTASGLTYWVLSNPAPTWVQSLFKVAHDGMAPDRWRTTFIVDALDELIATGDITEFDGEPDKDIAVLGDWVGSHPDRHLRCNQEADNLGGAPDTIKEWLMMGQWSERREVTGYVGNALEARLEQVRADEAKAAEVEAHITGLLGLMGP